MYSTIELRWFYPGELPLDILDWFNGLDSPPNLPDSRADIYLQPVNADVGVKLRQGNLELKYRQQNWGEIQIGSNLTGRVESWSKWICVDDIPDRLTIAKMEGKSGWMRVEKVRSQRLYRVNFTGGCQLLPITKPEDGAAAIEVTKLKLADRDWWTIACEYLGDDLQPDRELKLLVSSLLDGCNLPRSTSISCGYPEWLMEELNNLSC
jgi:hypothetical protein